MTQVYLKGGLGNQLFQIAAALSYDESVVHLLIAPDQEKHSALKRLTLPSIIVPTSFKPSLFLEKLLNASLVASGKKQSKVSTGERAILSRLIQRFMKDVQSVHISTNLGFSPFSSKDKEVLLVGYFQTHRYVAEPSVYRHLMSLKLKSHSKEFSRLEEIARDKRILIVHVRRGDYRKEQTFGLLSREYYVKAIKMATQFDNYDELWVFSDEPKVAREVVPKGYSKTVRFPEPRISDSAETFELMRMGAGFVIANSSYSWWAATLSKVSGCNVFSPEPWFSGRSSPAELVPEKWVAISAEFE